MKKIDELLGELMQAAYNCNKHDVFVNYSPHVEKADVQIYLGGWKRNNLPTETHSVCLGKKDAPLKLKALIGYIKHLGGEDK